MKEIKEFADKYKFAVKELKNNIIELIDFDSFIISKGWKKLTVNERFIFLETLIILNTTDNILQNHVISIENNQKYSRWNYGDYESLIINYLSYKPININEFAKEYPFLVKIENKILNLNDFDNVINSKTWQNLTYEKQTEILRIVNSKIIDEARKKRYNESKKRYTEYYNLKYELPETIINCNYLSEKWIDLDNDYGFFECILNNKPETKKEQKKYFKKELIRLYEVNKTEHIGLIKKTKKELILLGAEKKIKNIETEFKVINNLKRTKILPISKSISLTDMIPENELKKILKRLQEKEFVIKNSENKYIWKGSPLHSKNNIKSQLVALSLKLENKYNKAYTDTEIWESFTSFFNIDISKTMFKTSEIDNINPLKKLFSFL
ncbi:MAG: hypothetical protein L3J35_09370 [Bacteroidales bacterium]|nr:hypothetical protein [Bacteroidales bacterium]